MPAVISSVPVSVRTTDALVTSLLSIGMFGFDCEDEKTTGAALTDSDDADTVSTGYMLGRTVSIAPECDVDDNEADDDDEAFEDMTLMDKSETPLNDGSEGHEDWGTESDEENDVASFGGRVSPLVSGSLT